MIGKLTSQITIKKPVTSNDYGETNESWETVATVWAEILPQGSREAYRTAQVVGTLDYLVRCRVRTDVTSDCRITWGSRTLKVAAPPQDVIVDGTRMIEMPCVEVED
jgi:SPP1 family predicted phage head-tail adaptor